MRKQILFCIALVIPLLLINIDLAHATTWGNPLWSETWHNYTRYDPDEGGPKNATRTTILEDVQGKGYEIRISLVVSVYEYGVDFQYDCVKFRTSLYFESIAPWCGGIAPRIEYAELIIFKDGVNQDLSTITFVNDPVRPGYSQGSGLSKTSSLRSSFEDRVWWALKPLSLAVSLCEFFVDLPPVGIALNLIDLATSFEYRGGDVKNAGKSDGYAWSFWCNSGVPLSSVTRQYCLDSVYWKMDRVEPSTYYGLKVGAFIILSNDAEGLFDTVGLYLGDIGLRIYNRNYENDGGGCPTLLCWDGIEYVDEGTLDIHSESDITAYHVIQNYLKQEHGLYRLKLFERDNFTSHIDYVRLFAVSKRGIWYLCPLIYANLDNIKCVTRKLLFDDGDNINLHPNQTINLWFIPIIPKEETVCFVFELNGYNMKTPWSG